jgi:hypothetical protein
MQLIIKRLMEIIQFGACGFFSFDYLLKLSQRQRRNLYHLVDMFSVFESSLIRKVKSLKLH